MCRILGAVGPARPLDQLLYDPPCSLEHQAHAPRYQDLGRINADGWGVAWYDPLVDGGHRPARYRTATPMWADQRFRDIAPFIRSGHVVAAVRNASPGSPVEESGSSPFIAGRHAFTHNGFVSGFRGRLGVELRTGLSAARAEGILGAADSEVVFAMVLDQLDLGVPMAEALVAVIDRLHEVTDGKFNFLLSDGHTLVATREGNSLFTLERPARPDPAATSPAATDAVDPEPADAVQRIVASEPHDDDPAWCEVPDHAVVTVTATDLTVHPR